MRSPRAHPYSYVQVTYYSTASASSIPAGGIRLFMPNVARLQAVLADAAVVDLPLETAWDRSGEALTGARSPAGRAVTCADPADAGAGTATVDRVRLAVGEVVVYPAYGVGRVVARERRLVRGAEQEVVVVELADGLSVLLPIERAHEQLRPAVSAAGVRGIQERLREDSAPSLDNWPKRKQQTRAKLTGGDPLELAEVVRDGARHKQALAAKGSAQLASGEKVMYEKARQLLSAEIGIACGLDPMQADAWIDEQITAPAGSDQR